jgi:hypothetical protein
MVKSQEHGPLGLWKCGTDKRDDLHCSHTGLLPPWPEKEIEAGLARQAQLRRPSCRSLHAALMFDACLVIGQGGLS